MVSFLCVVIPEIRQIANVFAVQMVHEEQIYQGDNAAWT